MISRFALVGLAVAGLAGPASALAGRSDSDGIKGETGVETPTAAETKRVSHRRGRRGRQARGAAQDNPTLDNVAQGNAVQDTISHDAPFVPPVVGAEASEPAPNVPPRARRRLAKVAAAVAVLPPLRPSDDAAQAAPDVAPAPSGPALSVQTAQVDDPIAASIIRTVNVMPPLRPSIGGPPNGSLAQADRPASARPIVMASLEQGPMPRIFDWIEPAPGESPVSIVRMLPPIRPAFRAHKESVETAALDTEAPIAPTALPTQPSAPPAQPSLFGALFGPASQSTPTTSPSSTVLPELSGAGHHGIDAMIEAQAKANGVPIALVHRVVIRESRYNPRAVGRGGALGLMQIKHATARALGYAGPASGLLDANTNLTYAVKYLAGAYRTAGGNFDQAVSYYARGYYYAAKRKGLVRSAYHHGRHAHYRQEADATPVLTQPAPTAATVSVERASNTAR